MIQGMSSASQSFIGSAPLLAQLVSETSIRKTVLKDWWPFSISLVDKYCLLTYWTILVTLWKHLIKLLMKTKITIVSYNLWAWLKNLTQTEISKKNTQRKLFLTLSIIGKTTLTIVFHKKSIKVFSLNYQTKSKQKFSKTFCSDRLWKDTANFLNFQNLSANIVITHGEMMNTLSLWLL